MLNSNLKQVCTLDTSNKGATMPRRMLDFAKNGLIVHVQFQGDVLMFEGVYDPNPRGGEVHIDIHLCCETMLAFLK
jgi:hypothetical protein